MTDGNDLATLGVRLRELRTAAGLKQTALARRAGLSQSMLSRLERGTRGRRTPPRVLARLAEALGVRPGEIMTLGPLGLSGKAADEKIKT